MSVLREYAQEYVKIITSDGRCYLGKLEGFDQNINLVLTDSKERLFSNNDQDFTKDLNLGSVVLRGDNIVCIGIVDDSVEGLIDYTKMKGSILKDTENRC